MNICRPNDVDDTQAYRIDNVLDEPPAQLAQGIVLFTVSGGEEGAPATRGSQAVLFLGLGIIHIIWALYILYMRL